MINTLHPDLEGFKHHYERGKIGKNLSISMGFKRLSRYVGIRKKVYYLIGGFTGSGKTTLVDDAFVLNPSSWFLNENKNPNVDFKIIYFSMERSKDYKIARWLSRTIFLQEGEIIPVEVILGWERIPDEKEKDLIDRYLPFINRLFEEIIILREGPINPTGAYKFIEEFYKDRGHVDEIIITDKKSAKEYRKKVWIPDNPDEIILIITDTINLTKDEKNEGRYLNGKDLLDKYSEYMRHARDFYSASPVAVSQFNREIANPIRLKNADVQPQLEDFSGTSGTQNDAEVVIALFDPMRYKVADIYGYDLTKLIETDIDPYPGSKKYRQLSILKNSYGADGVGVGLAYQPQVGLFTELPYPKSMNDFDYQSVRNNGFFLK